MSNAPAYHVQAVQGLIRPDAIALASSHEHIFCTQTNFMSAPQVLDSVGITDSPIELTSLGRIRRNPLANRENLILDDLSEALAEISLFSAAGGNLIVDLTNDGFGRNPTLLNRVSEEIGVHIVMGSGFYVKETHPPQMDQLTVEDCADQIVRDIVEGVNESGIRAGIIGEIGCTPGISKNEEKALRAAAMAQVATGAPIAVHQPIPLSLRADGAMGSPTEGLKVLDILESEGADMEHVMLCHMDHSLTDSTYHKEVAARGCILGFDRFGNEWYYDSLGHWSEFRDSDRIRAIKWLGDNGYQNQIAVGQDICYKLCYVRYGGWGYAHLLNNVIPMMDALDLEPTFVDAMFRRTPQRFLTFREPKG